MHKYETRARYTYEGIPSWELLSLLGPRSTKVHSRHVDILSLCCCCCVQRTDILFFDIMAHTCYSDLESSKCPENQTVFPPRWEEYQPDVLLMAGEGVSHDS